MLNTLSESTDALNASGLIETGDLFYQGDIAQWKKPGNSLLLRTAMRLTKVDPAKAQQFVVKAINGGLLTSNKHSVLGEFLLQRSGSVGEFPSQWLSHSHPKSLSRKVHKRQLYQSPGISHRGVQCEPRELSGSCQSDRCR